MNTYLKYAITVLWSTFLVPNAMAIELKPDNKAVVALGKITYRSQCAACHGRSLRGQARWQKRRANGKLPAPPHDKSGHTWHHPGSMLFNITKFGPAELIGGDYKTDMPGFKNILSDEEIIAVLSYIKSTWPEDIRGRHDGMEQRHR
jgi:mono/diheme cytochrome c family protein